MSDWEDYERRFRAEVRHAHYARGFDGAYVERCLSYAKRLYERELPVIYDYEHLSRLVGYNTSYILGAANAPRKYYRTYSVPKRSGGQRTISEPLPSLKEIQQWINLNILAKVPAHRYAKGFVQGLSVRDNARFHRGQPHVLRVDVRDFFASIRFAKVLAQFRRMGYSRPVAVLLSRLCTLDGSLPQGAPTSPSLSNLVARRLDARISAFARSRKIRFTRYADDLTFSGALDPGEIIRFVRVVLADDSLEINPSKTRLMGRHQRQETTGVVVNARLNAPRSLRRRLREEAYFIGKFGLDSHLERIGMARGRHLDHLLGLATFAVFINPESAIANRALVQLRAEGRRSREL